jgi:hypothetical protein
MISVVYLGLLLIVCTIIFCIVLCMVMKQDYRGVDQYGKIGWFKYREGFFLSMFFAYFACVVGGIIIITLGV